MSIATLATYALPPIGLGLQLLGGLKTSLHVPDRDAHSGGSKGVARPLSDDDARRLSDDQALVGKTIQQVAALLFLARYAIKAGQTGDYFVAGGLGVGTAVIFVGGPLKPTVERLGPSPVAGNIKAFAAVAESGVLFCNLLNVLILNGSRDMNVGTLYERIPIGSSMAATAALTGLRVAFEA